jgi:MFS family permease
MSSIDKSHKATIYVLSFVILIDVLTIGLVIPIFAALFNDPHGILPASTSLATRNLLYALVISLPMFALLFGSPILGELSDRWGRKAVLLMSLLGVFISCLLSVLSFYLDSVVVLFVSRILVALMDGSQAIAQAAIIDISTKEDKVKNIALITLAGTVGFIIGPLLGGILSDHELCSWFGYSTPFWAAAIIALLNFFLLKFVFNDTRQMKEHIPATLVQVFTRLAKGFVDKRYHWVSMAFITAQFAWAGVFQSSSLLLAQKFHYTGAKLGLFTAYLAVVFSVFLLLILRVLTRYCSTITIARSGMALLGLGMLIYVFWLHSELAIWLAIIPMAAGMALTYNTQLALFSNAVASDEQGKVMGITVGLMAIGWLLAGLYIGHFATISYPLCFAGQAIVAFIGFGLLLLHRENTER